MASTPSPLTQTTDLVSSVARFSSGALILINWKISNFDIFKLYYEEIRYFENDSEDYKSENSFKIQWKVRIRKCQIGPKCVNGSGSAVIPQ